jgi:hypothetical protein
MAFFKKLKYILKRHSFFYKVRFKLLTKFVSKEHISRLSYNDLNPVCEIPKLYFEINVKIFPDKNVVLNDLEKAKTIAVWMVNNMGRGRGLGLSSEESLKLMLTEKAGVCSDFSQIFNNISVINNIKVKEWGFKSISKNREISGGHSFNEFYSRELNKWILIDSYKCIFFYKNDSTIPLSVFELFDSLKEHEKVIFKNLDPSYSTDPIRVKDMYLSFNSIPFFIANYHNKTYDFFLKKLHFLPIFFTHGLLYILGKSYKFLFIRELYFYKKTVS